MNKTKLLIIIFGQLCNKGICYLIKSIKESIIVREIKSNNLSFLDSLKLINNRNRIEIDR